MLPINLRTPFGGDGREHSFSNVPDNFLRTATWISLAFCLSMLSIGLLGFWLKLAS